MNDAIDGDDQCRQIVIFQVLDLVDEKRPGLARGFCCLTNADEELDQIIFEVSAVSEADLGIDGNRNVADGNLKRTREGAQGA